MRNQVFISGNFPRPRRGAASPSKPIRMRENVHRDGDEKRARNEHEHCGSQGQHPRQTSSEQIVHKSSATPKIPEWQLSRDAAIKALPQLRQDAMPLRSNDARVVTPQIRQAKAVLEELYQRYPDLRPSESENSEAGKG
jgi:hypothetical protein